MDWQCKDRWRGHDLTFKKKKKHLLGGAWMSLIRRWILLEANNVDFDVMINSPKNLNSELN